ncbi:MAG TPA: ribosome recycling factor [Treponemataceae bacterium]|jgi:ribosome recycling factor|nr:ribosome recycling factor [Treponema sp.]OQB05175.1 MAG: Ribosome-recycling factor [Spirochaetes bacterium ADurb.Bin215]HOF85001.1 ribosome recycling factor [Treponemataceae bacterium]HOS35251.1 ribosome recycling factor [Treponemataceae bacterium]HOU38256.1 ribosome recycling factor [Treponemataceae bacterium]
MSDMIDTHVERMKKSIQALKDEFNTIRTGRASASLFDKIRVDYYGEKSPLSQVATVSIPEARLVVIQPWDKNLIGEIEKAIQKSELSLNPSNDGKVIRIAIPPLTEERRKELAKHAKAVAEQSRVAVRNIRRDGNDELKKAQKDGTITEDELKASEDSIQKETDKFIQEINKILEDKEKEIMEG